MSPLPLLHRLPRPFEGTSGGPEVIVGARTCLFWEEEEEEEEEFIQNRTRAGRHY